MRVRRLWLSGMLLLALAACGFQPLYGQRSVSGGSISQEFSTIRIMPIAERTGQMLYNELRDRLNPRGKAELIKARQGLVLSAMAKEGYISSAESKAAAIDPDKSVFSSDCQNAR